MGVSPPSPIIVFCGDLSELLLSRFGRQIPVRMSLKGGLKWGKGGGREEREGGDKENHSLDLSDIFFFSISYICFRWNWKKKKHSVCLFVYTVFVFCVLRK